MQLGRARAHHNPEAVLEEGANRRVRLRREDPYARESVPVMLEHAEWLLFAWVLGNQAGVPVPVVPALLGAGALAGNGHLSVVVVVGIAVGASLAADLTWYGLGRWRGTGVLKALGRLAPSAGVLVRRAQRVFAAHAGTFQFGARFLPEMNAI